MFYDTSLKIKVCNVKKKKIVYGYFQKTNKSVFFHNFRRYLIVNNTLLLIVYLQYGKIDKLKQYIEWQSYVNPLFDLIILRSIYNYIDYYLPEKITEFHKFHKIFK